MTYAPWRAFYKTLLHASKGIDASIPFMAASSNRLGQQPFTLLTPVQIRVSLPKVNSTYSSMEIYPKSYQYEDEISETVCNIRRRTECCE